jgi:hypothetical protein
MPEQASLGKGVLARDCHGQSVLARPPGRGVWSRVRAGVPHGQLGRSRSLCYGLLILFRQSHIFASVDFFHSVTPQVFSCR